MSTELGLSIASLVFALANMAFAAGVIWQRVIRDGKEIDLLRAKTENLATKDDLREMEQRLIERMKAG